MRSCQLLLWAGLLAAATAQAGKVYRWIDAEGRVHYGDVPGSQAREVQEVGVRAGSVPAPQQQETKSPDPALEETGRLAVCEARRRQLDTYRNSARLIEKDNLGREHEFTAEERALLTDRTRVEIIELCGDGGEPPG